MTDILLLAIVAVFLLASVAVQGAILLELRALRHTRTARGSTRRQWVSVERKSS